MVSTETIYVFSSRDGQTATVTHLYRDGGRGQWEFFVGDPAYSPQRRFSRSDRNPRVRAGAQPVSLDTGLALSLRGRSERRPDVTMGCGYHGDEGVHLSSSQGP